MPTATTTTNANTRKAKAVTASQQPVPQSAAAITETVAEVEAGDTNKPAWVKEMLEKYISNVAPVFLLYGNIRDCPVKLGENLRSYLTNLFIGMEVMGEDGHPHPHFGITVMYSRSGRFSFPSDQAKRKFMEIANIQAAQTKLIPPLKDETINELARNSAIALGILAAVLSYKGSEAVPMAVMVEYSETLAPAADNLQDNDRTCYTVLADWAQDQIPGARGALQKLHHIVTLIADNPKGMYGPLRRVLKEQIRLPMPGYAQRQAFIQHQLLSPQAYGKRVTVAADVSVADIARLTPGLTLLGLEDVFLQAVFRKQFVTMELVKRRKDELIAAEFSDVMAISDATLTFDSLGGMTTQKAFLSKHVIEPMKRGRVERVPNGVLLTGPAGTGKSVLAEAIAGELRCTFIRFKIDKIKSKFVGESEQNLARALDALDVIYPAVLFIDEIDQVVNQNRDSSGDSGVSNNLFGMLLTWAADTRRRGKVLMIAATNRPDMMDAAMKREGRFDLKIPILAPEADERAAILAVQLRRYFPAELLAAAGEVLPQASELMELAELMEGYTGAIIERIASIAFSEWDDAAGGDGTTAAAAISVLEAVRLATEVVIPTTQDIETMTRLALETCSDLRVVPERYRSQVVELARSRGHRASLAGAGAGAGGNDPNSRAEDSFFRGAGAGINF